MDAYVITLRIIHILLGAFWFGAAAVFALFIEPAAGAVGPSAGPFMTELMQKKKLPNVIGVVALVGMIAGVLLYGRASDWFSNDWMQTGTGIAFTIGAISAIVSYVIGFSVIRPTMNRVGQLSAGGGSPEIPALLHKAQRAGRINLALLVIAVAMMASARYL